MLFIHSVPLSFGVCLKVDVLLLIIDKLIFIYIVFMFLTYDNL